MLHNQCQTLVSALAPKRRKITQVFNLPSIGSQVWLDLQPSKSCNFYPSECQICWLQTSHPSGLLTQLLHQLGHTHTHTPHTCTHTYTHTTQTCTHTHTTHTCTHTYTHSLDLRWLLCKWPGCYALDTNEACPLLPQPLQRGGPFPV